MQERGSGWNPRAWKVGLPANLKPPSPRLLRSRVCAAGLLGLARQCHDSYATRASSYSNINGARMRGRREHRNDHVMCDRPNYLAGGLDKAVPPTSFCSRMAVGGHVCERELGLALPGLPRRAREGTDGTAEGPGPRRQVARGYKMGKLGVR